MALLPLCALFFSKANIAHPPKEVFNVRKTFNQLGFKFKQRLIDDDHRYRFQIILLPLITGIISIGMSVINFLTGEYALMTATSVFAVLSFFCSIFSYLCRKRINVSYIIFNTMLVCMCIYFVINGGADGFSPLWIILMPTCGLTFNGKKRGSVFCAIIFAFLVFLMWTPLGRSFLLYKYGDTFLFRFPLLFFACYFIGLFFESARKITYDSLKETQQELWLLSVKDGMTGINNHAKFTQDLDALLNDEADTEHSAGFIYVDINGLKQVNDTQSHDVGDRMIYSCVNVLTSRFSNDICYRMGGDEFIVFLKDCTEEYFNEQIRLLREDYDAVTDVSVAVGGAYAGTKDSIRAAVIESDSNMQQIKNAYYQQSGRDRRTSGTPSEA